MEWDGAIIGWAKSSTLYEKHTLSGFSSDEIGCRYSSSYSAVIYRVDRTAGTYVAMYLSTIVIDYTCPPPQFSRLGTWCPAFVCVCLCVCVCVCLVVFCIWVEGLCVVVWRGNKWGGWLWILLYIASMLYTWFFHTVQYTPLWGNRSYSYL